MLDKKQIWEIFLSGFKKGYRAAETTLNINNTLAQELLMNVQCSGGSIKFCKGSESLEDEEHRSWPSEVVNDQLRTNIQADLLPTTEEAVQELNVDLSLFVHYLKVER